MHGLRQFDKYVTHVFKKLRNFCYEYLSSKCIHNISKSYVFCYVASAKSLGHWCFPHGYGLVTTTQWVSDHYLLGVSYNSEPPKMVGFLIAKIHVG